MSINEKKVKQLINLMNSMSNTHIMAHKSIIEMFNIAMDEKMVDYLLRLGNNYYTKEELKDVYVELYGKDGLDEFYGELMNMSLVHPKSDEERHLYGVSPIFPGWVEFYTSGPMNPKRQAILEKFIEFWSLLEKLNIGPIRFFWDQKTINKMKKGIAPPVATYTNPVREINLDQELKSKQEIYIAGDVFSLLKKHKDEIAVMNCFCRTHKKLTTGNDCDLGIPIEGCMTLGALASQVVDSGVAKYLRYEEAVELLEEFERKGCIHTAFHYHNNSENDAIVICNCCKDCCLLYKGYNNGAISNLYARSFYKPEVIDINRCVGCNICSKYCPTDATYYDRENKQLVFIYDKCIGCGQCVTQCHFDVRKMVKDERDVYVKTKKKSELK